MTKEQAVALIDEAKRNLLSPVDLLNWVWLRVIILSISDEDWDAAVARATTTLEK